MQHCYIIGAIVTLALIATTYAETTCQTHQRNSRNSAHGVSWNIQCNANGEYEPPLQCMNGEEKDKWCGCYNKEEQISGPGKKLRHCECAFARKEAMDSGTCAPKCARTGKWEPKQCCGEGANKKCHCVNVDTGAKTTDTSCLA